MSEQDTMRERFKALSERRETILKQSAPLREKRDRIAQEAEAKVAALNAEIKAIEAPVFQLEQDIGALSRALKGAVTTAPQK